MWKIRFFLFTFFFGYCKPFIAFAFDCPFNNITKNDCIEYFDIKNNYSIANLDKKYLMKKRIKELEFNILPAEERISILKDKMDNINLSLLLPENIINTISPMYKLYQTVTSEDKYILIKYYIEGYKISDENKDIVSTYLDNHLKIITGKIKVKNKKKDAFALF